MTIAIGFIVIFLIVAFVVSEFWRTYASPRLATVSDIMSDFGKARDRLVDASKAHTGAALEKRDEANDLVAQAQYHEQHAANTAAVAAKVSAIISTTGTPPNVPNAGPSVPRPSAAPVAKAAG